MERGATAGKYDPFGGYPGPDRQLSTAVLNEVREMIAGIREGGPSFDICVEAHGKFNIASAGRIVKMLEPFDPFFLEEPVPPENVDAMAALQASTNIPIAAGEGVLPGPTKETLPGQSLFRLSWEPVLQPRRLLTVRSPAMPGTGPES